MKHDTEDTEAQLVAVVRRKDGGPTLTIMREFFEPAEGMRALVYEGGKVVAWSVENADAVRVALEVAGWT